MKYLLKKMKYLLKLVSLLLSRGNYLTYLANIFFSDKGTLWPNRHNYTKHYHSLFKKNRYNKNLKFLEIGLCRGLDEGWAQNDVPSIKMWLNYFPHAKIYGYDYSDFSFFKHERVSIFQGDQGNKKHLNDFININGGEFDVIIDDASHASHHQQISLGFLFPYLKKGGYYIIEDLDWQPSEIEKKEALEKVIDQEIMTISGVSGSGVEKILRELAKSVKIFREMESMENASVEKMDTEIDDIENSSIIDLSKKCKQPMSNENAKIQLTFNGEIYNHSELRKELEETGKYHWKTDHSDTEVIIKSYKVWGESCVEKFNGMFTLTMKIPKKTIFPSTKRKLCHWSSNSNINSNIPCISFISKLPGAGSITGE